MGREQAKIAPSVGDIAVVGMAARLPGAASVDQYWRNLADGVCSIRRLGPDALAAAGEDPDRAARPNYVPAAAPLDGYQLFDPGFFELGPKDAAIMDPQHRQFLEVAWEAFENAGRPPAGFDGRVGVWAGCGMGGYFYFNVCSNRDLVDQTGMFLLRHTGNDKDFLATRVSHVFDLKGPSVGVQTACSTSLVAVHMAGQSLALGECDMAVAGGVTIELPQNRGYLYEEGEILSPDGACHAFDHRAQGTVFGSGAGAVVLRRLEDALRDGDHIWAVIKGSAVNNDGSDKAGYLAPSISGQADAIAAAQAAAGVSAETISYVECHGTGTYLGDPIEVAALTDAFRRSTDAAGFCRIGSVKTNIGHLDTAAGVASLIKASLALHHKQMPPSLGFEAPNPAIDFAASPFTVNTALQDWSAAPGAPRRAGVTSLGVGGTNAHLVLEEAPERPATDPSDWPFQPLVMSAKSRSALDGAAKALASHLEARADQPLADVAWTLKEGRQAFDWRRVVVADSHDEAAALLTANDPRRVFTHQKLGDDPGAVFLFPGGGSQYAGMARDLYLTEPVFQDWMDKGLAILQPKLDYDIRALWLPEPGQEAAADARLTQPSVQLPLILITEYALAQLYMSWGVTPTALLGHSMGENAAACLAGVMSFEDCIGLVHLRGVLFDSVPAGGMLSVALPLAEVEALLADPVAGGALDLASVNAPELSVVSGPVAALDALEARLKARDVDCRRIAIDIAAHSRMLGDILAPFGDYLRSIKLNAPSIPILSNRTGRPLSAAEAMDPEYWVGHLRNTVRFADCVETLLETPNQIYLEMGPGKALSSLAQACGAPSNQVLSALRHPEDAIADDKHFMGVLMRLWALGAPIDWTPIWGEARRARLPLPTYAFDHQPYFIDAADAPATPAAPADLSRIDGVDNWAWKPVWRPALAACDLDEGGVPGQGARHDPTTPAGGEVWLVFVDEAGLARRVIDQLRSRGARVVEVRAGDAFAEIGPESYVLAPERGREGYDQLIAALLAADLAPTRIAHFWLVTAQERFRPGSDFFHRNLEHGFYSLMFLAQALAEEDAPTPSHIAVITTGAAQVQGEGLAYPEKSTILGPVRVIPREMPGLAMSAIDVALPRRERSLFSAKSAYQSELAALADRLVEDLSAPPASAVVAHRGERRYEQAYRAAPLPSVGEADSDGGGAEPPVFPVAPDGVWLITGAFGGVGLAIAEGLAKRAAAAGRAVRLALVARSPDQPQRARAVRRLEALGAEVLALRADVCNLGEMSAALDAARERFGAVDAVLHAAGAIDDGALLGKTAAGAAEVLAPKVQGLRVLDALLPDGALSVLALCASSSTATGPAGQVDYVAANEYLNAYAKSRAGGRTQVTAINWGLWAEVGMAADAVAARAGAAATSKSAISAPMLDAVSTDASGDRVFHATYQPEDRWFLDQHRTGAGDALVPGSGYLEMAAEALSTETATSTVEIRDVTFLRPLAVADGERREMRLRLSADLDGFDFSVESACKVDDRDAHQLHASGAVSALTGARPAPLDLAAIAARCPRHVSAAVGARLAAAQENHLSFGPRWRLLTETRLGGGEGLARLQLGEAYLGDLLGDLGAGYVLHPALLDIATGWAMGLIPGYDGAALWAPLRYGRLALHRPLPAVIFSWARLRPGADQSGADQSDFAEFDVTVTDPDGAVCAEIEGFAIKRLQPGAALAAAPAPRAAEVVFEAERGRRPLSPAEERLARNVSQGIPAAEGADAFLRAVATGRSQIVVSSLDLPSLIAQAGAADAPAETDAQSFERPSLDTAYVAPRTPIEETLAGFWQGLLGVNSIGVEDSFFDLGGHSLIAVRLFAMVKKAYRVDFPISVLFEAPTIARCAALIAERTAERVVSLDGAAPPARPAERSVHLVPMHDGEGGRKTPFFLVAGMFGNVLNLRHLAHLLGSERPVYGLQARGLYGGDAPHRCVREAAADYLADIRKVQPRGPYLIGGFSGGGIAAYEMAQQLSAAGETVGALVLLDTPLPVRPALSRIDRFYLKLNQLREQGARYLVDWASDRVAWEISRLKGVVSGAEAAPDHSFHNAEIRQAFLEAVAAYELARWSGPMSLFRPPLDRRWQVSGGAWVDRAREYVHHDNDWGRWAPQLQVFEVPGDHDSMVLEPNVRVLAGRLRTVLDAEDQPVMRPDPLATAAE